MIYRIVRNTTTLEYKVQYSYLGMFWSNCMYLPGGSTIASFNSLTQAEDFVDILRKRNIPNRWEVVRTYES